MRSRIICIIEQPFLQFNTIFMESRMQQRTSKPQEQPIRVIKLDIPASKLTQGGSGGIPEYFYAPDPMNWNNPNVTKYG